MFLASFSVMRLQWALAVALAAVIPSAEGCTGRYAKVPLPGFPNLPTPPNTCTYLCSQSQQETFQDARNECLGDGADLTTINSEEELKIVISYGRAFVWTGLYLADDGNWKNIDGSTAGYIRWSGGIPDSDPNKKCVGVTPSGMTNVLCDNAGNFLCERGLCQEYGGSCVSKREHCCKDKLIDSIFECSGDSSMICCKDFDNGAGSAGGLGGPGTGTPTPSVCTPAHQDSMCRVANEYLTRYDPATLYPPSYYITTGCVGTQRLPLSPECGGGSTCIRKRILNLLKCFVNACDKSLTVTGMLGHNEFPGDKNFCDGKCIRLVVPLTCSTTPLHQMCDDIMGSSTEEIGAHTGDEMYFTCCYNRPV